MTLRLIVAGALALALCSCASVATFVGASVTQQQAAAAVTGYNLAETAALTYLKLPLCTSGQTTLASACRNAGASKSINSALDTGDPAVDTLVSAIAAAQKAGTGIGVASAAYNAVAAATFTNSAGQTVPGATAALKAATPTS